MAADPAPVTAESWTPRCWCCGNEFAEVSLVHLGAHPEVAVCLGCAHYLKRRAGERRDEQRRSAPGAVRGGIGRIRHWVIEHRWHERGLLGVALRRLDRFLP